jgi:hypothetical protein
MESLLINGVVYKYFPFDSEDDFEKEIESHCKEIFGNESIYVSVKRRIGKGNILSIPDGYLIDFSFKNDPRLYIVENELSTHDPFAHIGQQLLKFSISYRASGRKIKELLLRDILKSETKKAFIEDKLQSLNIRNIDAFLESIIFDKPVGAIIVIDQVTDDLINVLNQLTMNTETVEFQTFVASGEDSSLHVHKYTPFQADIREFKESKVAGGAIEDVDTIVVPANKEGFEQTFLGENCWYAIRISKSMIDKIKYIAGYQTAPISAITYYAEVDRIEKYKDTDKFIIYFKEPAKKIGPLKLVPKPEGKVKAPQAPRYTTFARLMKAKNLDDVF